jgi:hypothetical protein
MLAIVGVLLVGAVAAAVTIIYRDYYSPSAFVERYLGLLADGRAADALAYPGVAVDSAELESAGLPPTSSDALLRRAALAPLDSIVRVSEVEDGDVVLVTVSYRAGPHTGTTTFEVEPAGWIGVVPAWRFAESPLAVLDITVRGSMRFAVNGFELDKRQVSIDGVDAAPLDPVAMLVFSPGFYNVSVDTPISATGGIDVLSDAPLADVTLDLQAEPTAEFIGVVQDRVDRFLEDCATQRVLQPTACPFGYIVEERIDDLPTWSIVDSPAVRVVPDGGDWAIPETEAVAHIEVDVVSLFDGSVRHVSEDIPFIVTAEITVLPDDTVSIRMGGP